MDNYVYCAVDKNNNIREVRGSSQRTTYFKTDKYLKGAVERHNKLRLSHVDEWRIARFKLVEAPECVICDSYRYSKQHEARYDKNGRIYRYEDVEYGRCLATKGLDFCNCKGNKKNCDFYEENRK